MERLGEDPPTDEDIAYFGFYQACKNTRGDFAIFRKDGSLAARGRTGTTPLYWNREKRVFSFEDELLEEFPEGHLYNADQDRLVCWDPMYFDKPLGVSVEDAVVTLKKLIKDAIKFRIDKCDAFLLSTKYGSMLVDSFIAPQTIHAYTAFASIVPGLEIDTKENRTMLFVETGGDLIQELAEYLSDETEDRKFMSGLGCKELFSGKDDFCTRRRHRIVEEFSNYGLEVYSPFLDSHVMEYVLDMTTPEIRPSILHRLVYG
jgi:asparagine synthetase B (glutamine-hydrolysing)